MKLTEIEGVQVRQVAEALEIHQWMLTGWRKLKREALLKGSVRVAIDKRKLLQIDPNAGPQTEFDKEVIVLLRRLPPHAG